MTLRAPTLPLALLTFALSACQAEEAEPSSSGSTCVGGKCDDTQDDGGFEFIVVGSGAGGGPLAANLARNNHRVLLLEAGTDTGDRLTYQVPAYHGLSTEDPAMQWDYFVKHYSDEDRAGRDSKMVFDDETGEQRGILYPRAGTLGGCTAHNAHIAIRPHRSDWDRIAELTGDPSWSASNMEQYFHRTRGWLNIEFADPTIALTDFSLQKVITSAGLAFVDATGQSILGQLGADISELVSLLKEDVNDVRPEKEGMYPFPIATRDGRRHGVREYLLETVEEGYPLTIQTGAFVTDLVYADEVSDDGHPRVVGVHFIGAEHQYRADPNTPVDGPLPEATEVRASREVIVSAGAFNSPQILKLSGIGPSAELEDQGIEVVVDLPGVGENLQDRYEVGVIGQQRGPFETLAECTYGTDPSEDPCLEQWMEHDGPYQTNGGVATLIKRSSRDLPDPDLFIFGVPGKFAGYEPGYSREATADKSLFTWLILKGHTQNTAGHVRLRSTDPRDMPEINFRYFDDGDVDAGQDIHDAEAMVAGVNFVRAIEHKTRRLMLAPMFGRYDEVWPGQDVQSAEDIERWVKDEAWGHHASCTAKLGADDDPMAVLDSRFGVRGVDGLRVVDASVFPEIPGFFIVMPIYMVSEKATDVILEDLGEERIEENQPTLEGS